MTSLLLRADTGMQGHLQASTSLPGTYANHQGSMILSSGNKNPETITGPVSLCGPVGKLILCQCSAEGCEEGQLPIGLCPSLPMMPLPPRMQCCPPMYVMYCSQQKRSMANRRAGGLNNSLLSQSSKMSPGL
uniref:Uncharacterized protein n=1 Tax=Magallana gigas TaxID=29159 RepID=K1PGH4_MAGGI